MLNVLYCLVAEDREHRVKVRQELDRKLASLRLGTGGRPDRATWGELPEHQEAMRRAMNA